MTAHHKVEVEEAEVAEEAQIVRWPRHGDNVAQVRRDLEEAQHDLLARQQRLN